MTESKQITITLYQDKSLIYEYIKQLYPLYHIPSFHVCRLDARKGKKRKKIEEVTSMISDRRVCVNQFSYL
jgi:hypothetical protein